MKRVLILVEGQTEERFVKNVLQPHLWAMEIDPIPTILVTKRVKNGPDFKGGISSFRPVERDLRRLLGDTNAALVTTMFDLYALPVDFPGYAESVHLHGPARAQALESALRAEFGNTPRFRAFLMVHEYEAILYCDVDRTIAVLGAAAKRRELTDVVDRYETPEHINDGPNTHPSARIAAICPHYRKTLHGPLIANRVGLSNIRDRCLHFGEWLNGLEAVGGPPMQ